ncbi:hypothetical protein M0804_010244 [Polistes exclamans]|nr:hypothetical protein M0804_010244 [Polistes exclamans]
MGRINRVIGKEKEKEKEKKEEEETLGNRNGGETIVEREIRGIVMGWVGVKSSQHFRVVRAGVEQPVKSVVESRTPVGGGGGGGGGGEGRRGGGGGGGWEEEEEEEDGKQTNDSTGAGTQQQQLLASRQF